MRELPGHALPAPHSLSLGMASETKVPAPASPSPSSVAFPAGLWDPYHGIPDSGRAPGQRRYGVLHGHGGG